MPLLSIIVPIYRAERFLHKCIDSILKQSLSDLELILVDDGSPDDSGKICDMYAQKDVRVKVIHQKNSGVSAARNRGLEEATGEFVGFVDSDDWISEFMYETMYNTAVTQNAEIVMCDIRAVCEDGTEKEDTIYQLAGDCLLMPEDRTPDLMPDFGGSACRCIYRRTLLEEYHIRFPEGLKFSEDRIFNIYAMGRARCISYIKKGLYLQYMNDQSCTHRYHDDFLQHLKLAAGKTREAIERIWDDDPFYQRAYLRHFYYGALAAVYRIKHAETGMSWAEKRKEIGIICADPDLKHAICEMGIRDLRSIMVLKEYVTFLYFTDMDSFQKIENVWTVYQSGGLKGIIKKCVSKLKSVV